MPDNPTMLEAAIERVEQADDPVEELYEIGADFTYGIGGAVEQGEVLRLPEQIDGQANCYELALFNHTVAEAAGMEPTFYEVVTQSPEMGHGFITVGREETVVDPYQGLNDTLEEMEDTVLQTAGGSQSISGFTVRDTQDLWNRVREYRSNPETVLYDGQRLITHDDDDVYEGIVYKPGNDTVRHVVTRYRDGIGFLNHQVIVEHPVDAPEDRRVLFCDTPEDVARTFEPMDILGQRHGDGDIEPLDLSERAKHNIEAVCLYDTLTGDDERIYTEAELKPFYEQFQKDHHHFLYGATAFNSNIGDWVSTIISSHGDVFWNTIDWLKFTESYGPFHGDVPDGAVEQYLERHEDIFQEFFVDAPDYAGNAATLIQQQRSVQSETDDRRRDAFPDLSRSQLAAAGFVDPELQEELDGIDWAVLTAEQNDYSEIFADAETTWRFDPATFTLSRTETMGGTTIFPFNSTVDIRYDVDWDGSIGDVTVSMTTAPKLGEPVYTLFETTVDTLDDLERGDVDAGWRYRIDDPDPVEQPDPLSDISAPMDVNQLKERKDARTERNRYDPEDIIDQQYRKIGLFAATAREEATLFDREELLLDLIGAFEEFTQLEQTSYLVLDEYQRITNSLDAIDDISGDLDLEHYANNLDEQDEDEDLSDVLAEAMNRFDGEDYALLEQNIVNAKLEDGKGNHLKTRVKDLPRRQREDALLWGYHDMLNALQARSNYQDTFHRLTRDGLALIAPDPNTISDYTDEHDLSHIETLLTDQAPTEDDRYLTALQEELAELPWQMKTGLAQHLDDDTYNTVRSAFNGDHTTQNFNTDLSPINA